MISELAAEAPRDEVEEDRGVTFRRPASSTKKAAAGFLSGTAPPLRRSLRVVT